MKYKLIIVLILSFTMMITSCTNRESLKGENTTYKEDNNESRFLYTIESGKLVRYDVVEHKEIVACPDPLCEHDTEDCPVSGISNFVHFTSDYIAYVKDGFADSSYIPYAEVYIYNLDSGVITTMLTGASQIYYPWISDDHEHVFFCAAVYEWDNSGNSTGEIWSSYRYDIISGELEILDENLGQGYRIIDDTGSKLLWYTSEGASYFWTDYEFGNVEEYDYPGDTVCGYYVYSDIQYTEHGDYYRTMYRKSIETGEVSLISDLVSEMRYDNRESPSGIAYAGFNYNEEYGYNAKSEIWYFDFDTMESRLLIDVKEISDEFDIVHIEYHAGYNDYAGGYMMIEIGHTYTYVNEDNEEKMSFYATHNLFINPKTGDWFIMEPLY
ncbi:MAG: hypothetical protein LUH54_02195 [Firmicutes bacterium]|nr:hypothetical protein [Bacillota bacterium]